MNVHGADELELCSAWVIALSISLQPFFQRLLLKLTSSWALSSFFFPASLAALVNKPEAEGGLELHGLDGGSKMIGPCRAI